MTHEAKPDGMRELVVEIAKALVAEPEAAGALLELLALTVTAFQVPTSLMPCPLASPGF